MQMSDQSNSSRVKDFLSNGSGAITFRLLATALSMLTIALVGYEGERINTRLDAAIAMTANNSTQIAVHESQLGNLDAGKTLLWNSVTNIG
jgi:hypothetical protein